ncbi:MAG TPA: thiopurine S-methyltransferase [Planctomycetes bacterium]|nr:thiopurine S-methyltransferase [Planctomycetota bacterium]HIL36002.1 thiopurine S-methyltransferase [Planctomycetota bacterium]
MRRMSMTQKDWRERYESADTPWDLGAPHPELQARIRAGELAPPRTGARALVPGCGHGHDALALCAAGWSVTALDCVELVAAEGSPGAQLRQGLARAGGSLEICDALAFSGQQKFDLVFEHTFFCALEPSARPAWGALVQRVLVSGGHLAVLLFPADKPVEEGGPPHRYAAPDMLEVLGNDFALNQDELVSTGVSKRSWQERWLTFSRA